ncbi:MAG: hypothetical protein U0359_32495 [Byssovorax sp.]
MNRAIPTFLLTLSLSAAAFTPGAALADAPSDNAQTINDIYQQANRLYDAGQLAEAEALYQKAWNVRHSYDVASNLGALELDLNKPARAASLLSYALRQFPANGSERAIHALKGRLDKARSLSCTLRLKVNVSGADIDVDGEPQGKSPSQDDLFVEPGKRTITVKLGKIVQQQVITAKAGQSADLTFELPSPSVGPRVAPSPQVITVPVEAPRSRIPGFVAGGAGLVGLGVGATLIGLAESNRAEAQRLHDQIAAAGGAARTARRTAPSSATPRPAPTCSATPASAPSWPARCSPRAGPPICSGPPRGRPRPRTKRSGRRLARCPPSRRRSPRPRRAVA